MTSTPAGYSAPSDPVAMTKRPLPNGPDPDGLSEFSVVYTDRALNHMSKKFQGIMKDLHETFTSTYGGESTILVPGGGSYAMEAVARQFVNKDDSVLVLRNGFFSFRWTQILEQAWPVGETPKPWEVVKAQPASSDGPHAFAPKPIEEVVAEIQKRKPVVMFAPHVETSAGILLPDAYLKYVAEAVHEVGGIFVLDCIASGTLWVNMKDLGIDALISAPQKGWSGPASTGVVVLGQRGVARLAETTSDSFALNLKQWDAVMKAYLGGGHMYHCTMPTDALATAHTVSAEMKQIGFPKLRDMQVELGRRVRELLASRGYLSVAAPGFEAPTVVVVHTKDATIAGKFAGAGMQIAAGVPLMVDHGTNSQSDEFRTFRLGLFGLDKLNDIDNCIRLLSEALDKVQS